MPHADAEAIYDLPTELIVVSCAIGQGHLLRLLYLVQFHRGQLFHLFYLVR